MRWLLLKDLRILRRSPLLVALLVLYPIVIAVLIGFALSRGPDKPEVAFYNGLEGQSAVVELGGERIDLASEGQRLFDAIDPVRVDSREEAIQKVEDGEVLGALIIPSDLATNIQSSLEPGTVEVYFNAEDPAKRQFVENTIKAQVQSANAALTKRVAKEALKLLDLISTGGEYSFLGQSFDVLGLERAEQILAKARAELPAGSPERAELDRVIAFGKLARENLSFSDEVLAVVGEPIRVKATALDGGTTSLTSFAVALAVAVSLMFITLLLAAGTLALEREENAFSRLVRGLVSKTGLLAEKAGLAAVCSVSVCLLMMAGLGLFVELDWGRFPLWLAALAVGALAFAALGLAIGALTRDVRAASLLAFMLCLPLAFLALVPSGAVAPALYDVIRAVSAVFPFQPALDALDAALNDAGGIGGPLLHLAGLTLGFGALARRRPATLRLMASANEALVRRVYAAANARDMDAILAGTHEDCEVHPVLGANLAADVYRGHEGVRQWTRDLWGEWESFDTSIGEVVERGDRLLYPVGLRGRGRASGAPFEAEIFHLTTVRDGLVLRIEGFSDRESAMRALEAT